MQKHIQELANSLEKNERAIFLSVFQYIKTQDKERLRSTNYDKVKETFDNTIKKELNFMNFN